MYFQPIPSTQITPDAVANPDQVPSSHLFQVPSSLPNSDFPVTKLSVTSTNPAGTPTVQFYGEIEKNPEPQLGQPTPQADRRFRLLGEIIAVAGEVVVGTFQAHQGTTYARITAGQAADTQVLIGFLP